MADLSNETNQVPKIYTPITTTVPNFAKQDPRKRWWCSRPDCCASVTVTRDLSRHYRDCHPDFLNTDGKVLAAEQATWINAQYLESGLASDEEKAAAVNMARRRQEELEARTRIIDEEPELIQNLPATPSSPSIALKTPLAAADLALNNLNKLRKPIDCTEWTLCELTKYIQLSFSRIGVVFSALQTLQKGETLEGRSFNTTIDQITRAVAVLGDLQTLALRLLPEESEDEEESKSESDDDEDDDDDDDEEDEEEEEAEETSPLLSPDWTSAQLLLHAAELRYHAWDLREDGQRRRAAACEDEAGEWEEEGVRVRGLEEAGLRVAWDFGPAVEQAAAGGPGVLAKGQYGA